VEDKITLTTRKVCQVLGGQKQRIMSLRPAWAKLVRHYLKNKNFQELVTHACNPRYLEVEIRRISVWGQPKQKVLEAPSQPIGRHVCICTPAVVGSTK
jgi:hypothetical protein